MFTTFQVRGCKRNSRYWFYLACQDIVLSKAKLRSVTTQVTHSKYIRSAPELAK